MCGVSTRLDSIERGVPESIVYSAGAESPIIADSYRDLFPGKEYCTEICNKIILLDEVPGIKSDPVPRSSTALAWRECVGKVFGPVPLQGYGYLLLYLMPREPVLYETRYTCIID
jgi:hypothetical protein